MRALKSLVVAVLGLLAALYLVNPGAGIFELIPDNFPLIGNLDEAAAVVLLLNCLSYFGIDLGNRFFRGGPRRGEPPELGERR
jgi:uncharacterized membrane protein YkvA (DUF1232 family)